MKPFVIKHIVLMVAQFKKGREREAADIIMARKLTFQKGKEFERLRNLVGKIEKTKSLIRSCRTNLR